MGCLEIREKLLDYIEGNVSDNDKTVIGAHLETCPVCRKEYVAYNKSWEALDGWRDIEPDPAYKAHFWEGVRKRETGLLSWVNAMCTKKNFVMAGCVIALMVVAMLILKPQEDDLFTEPYLAWRGIEIKNLSQYVRGGNGECETIVAFYHGKDILSLPEYVEDSNKHMEYYPNIEIGMWEMHIMDGAHEVIVDMISN